MAYEGKTLRRQKILYNSDSQANRLEYQLVIDGAKVTPEDATISIYEKGSSTALVTAQSMNLTGSILYYVLDTTTVATWPIATGYRAELTITYSTQIYKRQVIFDVVRWLLDVSLGYDQLIAYDAGIEGMRNADDEDFSELIESCRDNLYVMIESKVIKDGKMLENMIIDPTRIAVIFKLYVLSKLWYSKGDDTRGERYDKEFSNLFKDVMGSMQFDKSQDGDEDAKLDEIQDVRIVT